jgi:tetratricopeptide (TPR) repeat protein
LAVLDAEALASRALDAANLAADRSVGGRALLVRARARDVAASWVRAHEDIRAAVVLARETGDRRLEMQALRQLSGDVPVGVGLPVHEYARHLEEAQVIARALGDREMQVDLLARQAVICTNRLLFSEALQHGRDAVDLARSSGSEAALCQALDGLKTGYAYLGEVGQLGEVIVELEPMVRARQDLFLLQWVIFESAFVPLAVGDFVTADRLFETAIAMCRHGGWVSYQGWFLAHRGWAARLAGDLSLARDYGRESVQLADEHGHFWWQPAALAIQAETLLAVDEGAAALTLLERALPVATDSGVEGYRLRALGVYAEASGSEDALREAEELLAQVDCPPGSVWLLGTDAYLAIARALLARGEPGRALEVVGPLIAAARRVPFRPLLPLAEAVRERAVVAAT